MSKYNNSLIQFSKLIYMYIIVWNQKEYIKVRIHRFTKTIHFSKTASKSKTTELKINFFLVPKF